MKKVIYVGESTIIEKEPGIFVESITEHKYKATIKQVRTRIGSSTQVNTELVTTNVLSIVPPKNSWDDIYKYIYVRIDKTKYSVKINSIAGVRVDITLGGVYSG